MDILGGWPKNILNFHRSSIKMCSQIIIKNVALENVENAKRNNIFYEAKVGLACSVKRAHKMRKKGTVDDVAYTIQYQK